MKLLFKKDEESQISVLQVVDGQPKDFVYVDMIKTLIETKSMDVPEITGNFTEAEQKSINSMVLLINEVISPSEETAEETQ